MFELKLVALRIRSAFVAGPDFGQVESETGSRGFGGLDDGGAASYSAGEQIGWLAMGKYAGVAEEGAMRALMGWVGVVGALILPVALAQGNGPFPAGALEAKSVVILNETHTGTVEDGANEALKQWGHWKVTDDVDAADVVLEFSKKSERTTSGSNKADDKGNSTSYGVTLSSDATITMTATAKGGFAPFYKTETKDAKQKAGRECVQAFIGAWQDQRKRVGR